MVLAQALLGVLALYVLAGTVVVVMLHARGLAQLDPTTSGAGWAFRAIITPGLVALWPWMLVKWRRIVRQGRVGSAHAGAAGAGGGS